MDKQKTTLDFDRETAISMGYKYLNGDEENGIFIDYEKNFTIHDPSTPELYKEINNGGVIPGRVKSCNLDDIITLVNYMKNNSLGPWEKKN